MCNFYRCKSFYLKDITFTAKGDFPVYACDRGHNISNKCNKACADFQKKYLANRGRRLAFAF